MLSKGLSSKIGMGDSISASVAKFGHLEKQKSDILAKSPSELAAQVMSGSNVNLALIQRIKSMGKTSTTSADEYSRAFDKT